MAHRNSLTSSSRWFLTGLLTTCALIGAEHRPGEFQFVEPAPTAHARVTLNEALNTGAGTGALVVDLLDPAEGEDATPDQLAAFVRAVDDDPGLTMSLASTYAESDNLYIVDGPLERLQALRGKLDVHPLVEGTEPELIYTLPDAAISAVGDDVTPIVPSKPDRPRFVPDDPMFPLQWHLEAIKAPEAWTLTKGEDTVVAVIDTGVAYKNLDWKGVKVRAVPDLEGIDFVDGETFVDNAVPEGLDDHAHGTHVAGTIAQATDNGRGVAGVAHQAKIMPLKVLGSSGGGSVPGIAAAIRYAADHGAHVINMSLGGPLPSRVMSKAVEYAHKKGTTVVCAAGNEKRARVSYPAAYDGAVAVAATDFSGGRSFYSNWGKALDVSAPGGDTRADKNGDGHPDGVLQNTIKIQRPDQNDYLWFQGTSMASPHVAGVAALIAASGVTNPVEVERILKATAVHPKKVEWDKDFGAGIIDAHAAVMAAKGAAYRTERGLLGLLLAGWMVAGLGVVGLRRRHALFAVGTAGVGAVFAAPYALSGLAVGTNALFTLSLSVGIPAAIALVSLQRRALRPALAGLAAAWAAVSLHGAIVLPTVLTSLPGGTGWDRAFLAINAIACGLLARRIMSSATAPAPSALRRIG